MPPRPLQKPKRPGEEFAREQLDPSTSSSKKPRFDTRNPSALAPDAPEEDDVDPLLAASTIGKTNQPKRNAVHIDGYDSDSSNEGFEARAATKAKDTRKNGEGKSKDEEENDMFADLDEQSNDGDEGEELMAEGKKKRKEVRFLGADEIEGQVQSSTAGGHVSADFSLGHSGIAPAQKSKEKDAESSDSDVDEEIRAEVDNVDEEVGAGGKKEHAPLIDAFNMKGEQEEGRFDDAGNFVRKARDPDAVHDSWLEGVSKKDMKRAREGKERREEEVRERGRRDEEILTSDALGALIGRLERGETVLEGLARVGKGGKRKPKWKKKNEMDVDEVEDPKEVKRREAVEAVTEAADLLLTRGQTEIYEAEREVLTRQYARETGEDWVDWPRNGKGGENGGTGKMWEYQWEDRRDGGTVNGPFDGGMMRSWNEAGYFGEGVEFREVGRGEGWERVVEFV